MNKTIIDELKTIRTRITKIYMDLSAEDNKHLEADSTLIQDIKYLEQGKEEGETNMAIDSIAHDKFMIKFNELCEENIAENINTELLIKQVTEAINNWSE